MLLIQNKGEAPVEAYTLLGFSTSRGDESKIGQFGTGNKHGICTLLRAGLEVIIYCGRTKLIFATREDTVGDVATKRVTVKIGNRKPKDLDWILDFGAIDWTEVRMALREFVANAIDQHGDDTEGFKIQLDMNPKASTGYTRIFIEESSDVREFYRTLNQQFLHFSNQDKTPVIRKESLSECRIYRDGVFVRSLNSPSLCDYNLPGALLDIDECRNLGDYSARVAISQYYQSRATVDELAYVFRNLENTNTVESNLDQFHLTWGSPREEWEEAWKQVFGDATFCSEDQVSVGQFAERKGYDVKLVKSKPWFEALKTQNIRNVNDVLTGSEQKGNTVTPPTYEANDAVNTVWEWVRGANLENGATKPSVKGFESIMSGGEDLHGYYDNGVVYLRNDLGGPVLLQTAIEEVAHHVTGAVDGSRDLQDFAFRLITRWLS